MSETEETPNPAVIHYVGARWECDIEIPREQLLRAQNETTGWTSMLVHGATVDRRNG